jgi:hypothetical protein
MCTFTCSSEYPTFFVWKYLKGIFNFLEGQPRQVPHQRQSVRRGQAVHQGTRPPPTSRSQNDGE